MVRVLFRQHLRDAHELDADERRNGDERTVDDKEITRPNQIIDVPCRNRIADRTERWHQGGRDGDTWDDVVTHLLLCPDDASGPPGEGDDDIPNRRFGSGDDFITCIGDWGDGEIDGCDGETDRDLDEQ